MSDEEKTREPSQQEWERAVFYVQTFMIPLSQAGVGEMRKLVAEFSEQTYEIPHSRRHSVSESAIWRMWRKYREAGMDGLCRKPRNDAGRYRVLPAHLLKRAIEIRQDLSSRSVRRILKQLGTEFPLEIDQVKRSTLSKALAAAGCSRVKPRREKPAPSKERHIHMRWERPLDLVQSDVCGQALWVTELGQVCKAVLIAVLDHCTKLCLYGAWFLAANLPALEKAVTTALLRFGIFKRLHVDHGKIFESYLLTNICSEMGTSLKFTRVGYAPGKGGIERYFLTVEEDFIPEVGDSRRFSLQQLNEKYWAWEHEYNHQVHSATGEAPAERYQRLMGDDAHFPDPLRLYRASLLREKRVVDKRFCTVRVRCLSFVVHPSLRGKTVQVRYDPFTLTEVLVYNADGGRFLQKSTPQSPDEKPAPFLPDKPAHKTPSIDALAVLEAEHAEFLATQKGKTASPPRGKGGRFASFCQSMARILKRTLSSFELSSLREQWEQYGPFESGWAQDFLGSMVTREGDALHFHEYLKALVEAKLAQESGDKPQ